jgi:hypothetical protein
MCHRCWLLPMRARHRPSCPAWMQERRRTTKCYRSTRTEPSLQRSVGRFDDGDAGQDALVRNERLGLAAATFGEVRRAVGPARSACCSRLPKLSGCGIAVPLLPGALPSRARAKRCRHRRADTPRSSCGSTTRGRRARADRSPNRAATARHLRRAAPAPATHGQGLHPADLTKEIAHQIDAMRAVVDQHAAAGDDGVDVPAPLHRDRRRKTVLGQHEASEIARARYALWPRSHPARAETWPTW